MGNSINVLALMCNYIEEEEKKKNYNHIHNNDYDKYYYEYDKYYYEYDKYYSIKKNEEKSIKKR